MAKRPYTFPARTKKDMLAFMESIGGRFSDRRFYPFVWNVKLPCVADSHTATALNEYATKQLSAEMDSAWLSETQGAYFNYNLIEAMRHQTENYSDYDGNDSFQFEFVGRSGGWLALTKVNGLILTGSNVTDFADWNLSKLRPLYRSLVAMESDFAPEQVRAEMLHHIAFARESWEESERERINAAKAQEQVRLLEFVRLRLTIDVERDAVQSAIDLILLTELSA